MWPMMRSTLRRTRLDVELHRAGYTLQVVLPFTQRYSGQYTETASNQESTIMPASHRHEHRIRMAPNVVVASVDASS